MTTEAIISVFIGIGLATAAGLRVFIPLLAVSVASHFGYLPVSPGFQWMASTPALIAFSVAACVEIGGYYIPYLDHLLDVISTPTAMIAGTIVSVALMSNVDPFYKWALGIIAGGGMAGLVQGTTVVARGVSTAGTGGLGNPLLATAELFGSILLSVLSIVVPILVVMLVGLILFIVAFRFLRRKSPPPVAPQTS